MLIHKVKTSLRTKSKGNIFIWLLENNKPTPDNRLKKKQKNKKTKKQKKKLSIPVNSFRGQRHLVFSHINDPVVVLVPSLWAAVHYLKSSFKAEKNNEMEMYLHPTPPESAHNLKQPESSSWNNLAAFTTSALNLSVCKMPTSVCKNSVQK